MALAVLAVMGVLFAEQLIWPTPANHGPSVAARLVFLCPALVFLPAIRRWVAADRRRPQGEPVDRESAPELFRLLDQFQRAAGLSGELGVRVVSDMNAAVHQQLRPWLFGVQTTVVLGLPLFLSTSPAQFRAILAHEFGHLACGRSGFNAYAAAMRAAWHRVLSRVEDECSWPARLVAPLLAPFSGRYLRDALRLSRAEEHEADAFASRLVGGENLAGALMEVALIEHFLERDFWRKVHAQADDQMRPCIRPYREMSHALRAGFDPAEALSTHGDELLQGDASGDDAMRTHPSIRERCDRIAAPVSLVRRRGGFAGERYLGETLGELAAVFDRDWWSENCAEWRARYKEMRTARRQLDRLEARAGQSPRAAYEFACLVERYCADRDPLVSYVELLKQEGSTPEVSLAVGRLLAERDDPDCERHLRRAVRWDSDVGLAAALQLVIYASRNATNDLARQANERAVDLLRLFREVSDELSQDIRGGGWSGHGLDRLDRYRLRNALAELPLCRVRMVRWHSQRLADWKAYLVVIRGDEADDGLQAAVAEMVGAVVGDGCPVRVVAVPRGSELEHAVAEIPASCVFQRTPAANSDSETVQQLLQRGQPFLDGHHAG